MQPGIKKSNPWVTLSSEKIHENPWFGIRQDLVRTQTGDKISYTYMEHPGAVAIVPMTLDGRIVMIKSYRYVVKDWCWEIPMGGCDHPDLELVARKELKEEVGGVAEKLAYINNFYANNGVSNIRCDVFLAKGVKLGQNFPEVAELFEIHQFSRERVYQMARTGQIKDGMSALSLFLCEPFI
jgi:ADP-ribose pyrophosphatase